MCIRDRAKIYIKAGNGGSGSASFRREKFIEFGGPDGGDGGKGGSIILKVDKQLTTLQDVSYNRHYKAQRGQHGLGKNMHGKSGKDLILKVPPGTTVKNQLTDQVVVDMIEQNFEYVICKGGNGGFGNARFKTSTKQAPRKAQPGVEGESGIFEIELKVLADVGLVGLPNAGKSTLLSSFSSARPKVADYPFTTLKPNLGIVKYGEYESFVMADIPGLIKGASLGKGLGHQFLRHIERNRIHIYLIDCMEENPYDIYITLKNELKNFNKDLIKKNDDIPSIASGIFGYIGYDFVANIEDLPKEKIDEFDVPDSILLRPSITVVFDKELKEILICKAVWYVDGVDADNAYNFAIDEINLSLIHI